MYLSFHRFRATKALTCFLLLRLGCILVIVFSWKKMRRICLLMSITTINNYIVGVFLQLTFSDMKCWFTPLSCETIRHFSLAVFVFTVLYHDIRNRSNLYIQLIFRQFLLYDGTFTLVITYIWSIMIIIWLTKKFQLHYISWVV